MEKPLAQVAPAVPAAGFWNKRRALVTAGVAALVVIAALASWRIFLARPVLTGTDIILLASFVNKTGDPIFDNSLDKALQIKLTESPFLSVLPEGSVRETLRTMRRVPAQRRGCQLDQRCPIRDLKRRVDAELNQVPHSCSTTDMAAHMISAHETSNVCVPIRDGPWAVGNPSAV